jgi:cysteinyl-tRNA synthetase
MKVYNTLTRQKEDFKPLQNNAVSIYSCGPTVYNYAHIGNLRTYIFMDILRRVLKYNGYSLKQVMNITDVGHLVSDSDDGEDKMLKGAREQQKSPMEIAEYYTNVFFDDIKALNIEKPEIVPKATDHINEMIEFVSILEDKGYAYETSDGIYFDIGKFKDYGKLSRINLEEQMAGARVEINDEKRHPADFALWKKAPKEHIMQWPSPWGQGYPGWHIECSAMSKKYLGEVFDIHTGGVDHIPIHHENEIAQSEALLGKPAVNYWMHAEFMLVNNGKMSKSLKNTYTVADLKAKGYKPIVFRYFCLNAHYRNKLNYTWEGLQAAGVSYERLIEAALTHKAGVDDVDPVIISSFKAEFDNSINDDLNIPRALGVAWNIARYSKKSKALFDLLVSMDSVFGLDIANAEKVKEDPENLGPIIEDLINQRQQARKDKNWRLADEIRNKLKDMGIILEDTPQGVSWKKAE